MHCLLRVPLWTSRTTIYNGHKLESCNMLTWAKSPVLHQKQAWVLWTKAQWLNCHISYPTPLRKHAESQQNDSQTGSCA